VCCGQRLEASSSGRRLLPLIARSVPSGGALENASGQKVALKVSKHKLQLQEKEIAM
jgi:hypothetical protein